MVTAGKNADNADTSRNISLVDVVVTPTRRGVPVPFIGEARLLATHPLLHEIAWVFRC